MAEVYHLRCRHCGEPMKNNPWPYCPPCNLELCYRAMPFLLGMLLTGNPAMKAQAAKVHSDDLRWKRYPHLKYIMD